MRHLNEVVILMYILSVDCILDLLEAGKLPDDFNEKLLTKFCHDFLNDLICNYFKQ